jgi:hypothetical protein
MLVPPLLTREQGRKLESKSVLEKSLNAKLTHQLEKGSAAKRAAH